MRLRATRGAAVEVLVDEVNRNPVLALTGGEHAPVGMQSSVFRQQRRVDVQDAAAVAAHEIPAKYAHETGQRDQVGSERVDCLQQGEVERGAVRKIAMLYDRGRNARPRRAPQTISFGFIAHHCRDLKIPARKTGR